MKFISFVLLTATFVASAASGFAQETAASKPDLAKGEASFGAVCAACHGPDGNAPLADFPSLAGQHPEYLFKQLMEFKDGKRQNPIMLGMAATLSEEDMKNVAYWLGANKAAPAAAVEAAPAEAAAPDAEAEAPLDPAVIEKLIAQGKSIYVGGVLERNIPACSGCHGPSALGIPAQYPRLKDQHAKYIVAQLESFRAGVRNNNPAMLGVAGRLNDQDIKAVAQYLSSLK